VDGFTFRLIRQAPQSPAKTELAHHFLESANSHPACSTCAGFRARDPQTPARVVTTPGPPQGPRPTREGVCFVDGAPGCDDVTLMLQEHS